MRIEWDDAKTAADREKQGLDFADFAGFDNEPATDVDDRADYGELRYALLAASAERLMRSLSRCDRTRSA